MIQLHNFEFKQQQIQMSALGAKTLGFKNILITMCECFYLEKKKSFSP